MRFRKLRIAWSVVWGVVAVLLMVLWVRSCSREEDISSYNCYFTSRWSEMYFVYTRGDYGRPKKWYAYSGPFLEVTKHWRYDEGSFAWQNYLASGYFQVRMPHWFAVVACTVFAAIPWACTFNWRFSLRTLLIATTLMAVALGAIVYAVR